MKLPHDHIDPDGLQEFSVVFTDRSLNHMSARFQGVMRGLSAGLKEVYGASALALVPGGGTYGMEAVARQFGRGRALVVRNGWFSYRWSQIFDAMGAGDVTVVMARTQGNGAASPFAPPPVEEVVASSRSSARGPIITTPTAGEADHPFCGAEISTSTPRAAISTQTQPLAMQSSTISAPTSWAAAAISAI